ncbi:MAG: hypothetical protein R2729_15430 [Bryobacteraceae bacterium]
MNGGLLACLKRFVLWDYARATWQYDVMVGLILAFIFLTPRDAFSDQPRPKEVILLSTHQDSSSFLVEPELLTGLEGPALDTEAQRLVRSQAGNRNRVVDRVEPVYGKDKKEVRGYIVYTKP